MNVTREDVEFCKRKQAEYLSKVEELEAKAKVCKPSQRGAYMSHAGQNRKNAERMQNNYEVQMRWLAENDPLLYQELKSNEHKATT